MCFGDWQTRVRLEEYTFISSNQIKISFIHVARSHNHIASVSFPVCMVKDTLCPQTFNPCEEKLDVLGKKRKLSSGRELKKKKEMEETTGRASEDGSLSQDGNTCSRCRMYGKGQHSHNLQAALTECLIKMIKHLKSVEQGDDGAGRLIAERCPSHTTSSPPRWPGRHKIISSNNRGDRSEEASHFTETQI